MAMERSQTPVEMNVRRRVGQASPSDSSQFVDESGSGDIFSVAVVHLDADRKMLDVYDGICIQDRSRDDSGSNTPEIDSATKSATAIAAIIDPRVNLIDRNILTDVRDMDRMSADAKTATIILPSSVDVTESQYCIMGYSTFLVALYEDTHYWNDDH